MFLNMLICFKKLDKIFLNLYFGSKKNSWVNSNDSTYLNFFFLIFRFNINYFIGIFIPGCFVLYILKAHKIFLILYRLFQTKKYLLEPKIIKIDYNKCQQKYKTTRQITIILHTLTSLKNISIQFQLFKN